jgi:elongation factor G
MSVSTDSLRNIALCGHSATGKTSLTEQILFAGGIIPKPEKVETGRTVSDSSEEEISRGISIHTSLSHLSWQDRKVNVLDCPGSGDFVGEVAAAFRAVESVLIVVSADAGVEIGTVSVWKRLDGRGLPRMVFINKMDKEHADFDKCLADLKEKFQTTFVPVTVPMGKAAGLKGAVDLIEMKAYLQQGEGQKAVKQDIPADLKDSVAAHRQALVEAAAEGDDTLMEKFFAEETLSSEEIIRGLAAAVRDRRMVPVFAGSAATGAGVDPFLNVLCAIGPAPCGEIPVVNEKGEPEGAVTIDPEAPPSAFVFKTSIDQFAGRLSYIKVFTGAISADTELINMREGKKEKLGKIYTAQGRKLEETASLPAGDIGILAKLATAATNDTLCAPERPVRYPPLQVPHPVHAVSVSAASKRDEDKMNQMFQRAMEEDPTFKVRYNRETRETVISGMGELHIAVLLEKIREQQKIEVQTRIPKIAYRETITAASDADYTHKKQTGGHGQYARVALEIKPLPRGEHFKFVNAIFGGAISKGYIPGVEKGVVEGMESGILAGYPVTDLEASVVDGKEHSVDSSEMAFKLAARGALKAAMEKAKPVLLEPVMNLTVYVEDRYLGDVLSDLSSKRGRVLSQDTLGGGIQEIKAQVPQAELLRYSIDLRAITSGTGSFETEFSHYNPITGKAADDVIKAAQAEKEEAKA